MKIKQFLRIQIGILSLTAPLLQGCAGNKDPGTSSQETSIKSSLSARPGDPHFKVENKTLFLVNEEGTHEIAPVMTVPAGRKFFRWVEEDEARRIDQLGFYPPHEITQKVDALESQRQGNGIYASTRSFDSKSYGGSLLIIEPSIDLLLVDRDHLLFRANFKELEVLSGSSRRGQEKELNLINGVNRGLRAAGIHGTFQMRAKNQIFEESWMVFFHPDALANVRGDSHPLLKDNPDLAKKFLRREKLTESEMSLIAPQLEDLKQALGAQ